MKKLGFANPFLQKNNNDVCCRFSSLDLSLVKQQSGNRAKNGTIQASGFMPTETKTYLHGDKDPPDLAYLFSWWQYFLSDRKENVWAAKCRRSALTRYAKASLSFFLGNDTEYLCCQGNLKL